jgi:hypothetical protein
MANGVAICNQNPRYKIPLILHREHILYTEKVKIKCRGGYRGDMINGKNEGQTQQNVN